MRWRRVFPGEGRQLAALRQWLASLLPECPARDDVICVATELGTNAVQHTASGGGGWFAVEVSWHGPAVRGAVADRQLQIINHLFLLLLNQWEDIRYGKNFPGKWETAGDPPERGLSSPCGAKASR